MARDWHEVFATGEGDPPIPAADPLEPEAEQRGLLRRLRDNLSKSRQALASEVQAALAGPLESDTWERLEEALIAADLGAVTTAEVVTRLEREAEAGDLQGGEALTARLSELLAEIARGTGESRIDVSGRPAVVLVVGVNGTGKTTTIGKLAWHLREELGRQVVIAAADTFRAAGVEQIGEWAQRAGARLVEGTAGADPASVAYEALQAASGGAGDVVIVDTAGRLHTQDDLMAELAKVGRVLARQLPGAPHETLLVIDATTGQNGLRQARLFAEAVPVSGIVLTKLDGTAKGGIAIAIARELGIPVKLIGVGERLEDLRPFDPDAFAQALLG